MWLNMHGDFCYFCIKNNSAEETTVRRQQHFVHFSLLLITYLMDFPAHIQSNLPRLQQNISINTQRSACISFAGTNDHVFSENFNKTFACRYVKRAHEIKKYALYIQVYIVHIYIYIYMYVNVENITLNKLYSSWHWTKWLFRFTETFILWLLDCLTHSEQRNCINTNTLVINS